MNRTTLSTLVKLLLSPVLLAVLGIILIVNPDGAVAAVTRVIAWALVLTALGLVLGNLSGSGRRRGGSLAAGAVCLLLGSWLITHPLAIAQGLGRLLGCVLIFEGAGDLLTLRGSRSARSVRKSGLILSLLTLGAGLVLVFVPMTFSQLLLTVCGIVLLIVAVVSLVNRLRLRRFLAEPDRPEIIDGETV